MTLPPAPTADPLLAQGLRRALDAAGYAPAPFERAVSGRERPASPLLRLFALGERVPVAEAEAALAPLGLDAAERLGVVRRDGVDVAPALRIVPHDVLLLASDLPAVPVPAEHVAAAHAPSHLLALLTVRRRVERALDVGTGNGVQALLLATHADRVVATDLNERALRFTELNAALNGVGNVETRRGSFLEPVAGETFGCVVCSPPYVVSPESRLLYRDAGRRGDELCRELVHDIPAHLDDGGFATVLVAWVPQGDEPEPLAWPPAGAEALVIRVATETAEETARYWHADLPAPDAERGVADWLAWYRKEGIAAIAHGAVVLRRGGEAWREWVDVPGGASGPAGAQLERIFAAQAAPRPPELVWAPDVQETRNGDAVTLAVRPGLGFAVELPTEAVDAVLRGDPAVEPLVADLHHLGFLVPAALGRVKPPL